MRPAKRGSELPFPPTTLAERVRSVQTRLRADGLAGALLFGAENIYYLTGFQSLGYFTYRTLLLPSAGRPTLVSRKVNQYLARVTPSLGGFVAIEGYRGPGGGRRRGVAADRPRTSRAGDRRVVPHGRAV